MNTPLAKGTITATLATALFAACVGDSPAGDAQQRGDASTAESGSPPPITGAEQGVVTVRVSALDLLRGTSVSVAVDAIPATGTTGPFVARLLDLPPGLKSPADGVLFDGLHVLVPLEATADANYGDVSLRVAVSRADGAPLGSAPLPVFVRGRRGALDTSFGTDGLAAAPTNGVLGGVLLAPDGTLYAVGASNDSARKTIVVHYTDLGTTDAAFAAAGELRFAPPGLVSVLPYGRGSWRESLRLQDDHLSFEGGYMTSSEASTSDNRIVRVTMPLGAGGNSPTFSALPDLPVACRYAQAAIADGDGSLSFTWQVGLTGDISRCHLDGTRDAQWPNTIFRLDTGIASRTYDFVAAADRLYVFGATTDGTSPLRFAIVLNRQSGAVVHKAAIPNLYSTSRTADSDGVLVAFAPDDAAPHGVCVRHFGPTGIETPVVGTVLAESCFLNPSKFNDFGGRPFTLADGSNGVVDYSDPGALHLADPRGNRITPEGGIALERSADLQAESALVDVIADKRGRLILVYASSPLSVPGTEPITNWKIRRFWL